MKKGRRRDWDRDKEEPAYFAGKIPPQNLEAEQGVLGSVLLVNEALDEVAQVLRQTHFYSTANKEIFACVLALNEKGVKIDVITLLEELERTNQLEDVGGIEYLEKILGSVTHAAHARYYADIVRDRWIQRTLTYACNEILKDCFEGGKETEDILASAEQKIFAILEQQEYVEKMAINEILIYAFDRINTRMEKEGDISGLTTGFVDLNKQLNGMQPTELIILAARPSMGKTALVCNMAEAAA